MTTLAQVIKRTERHLYGGEVRDERNRLAASISAGATTLSVSGPQGGIAQGARLAIELEELYVWEFSSATSIEVERGDGGTTAASHADGTTIFVNPKFSAFAILEAINEELADLSAPTNGLFDVDTVTLSYVAGVDAYDLTDVSDALGILSVSTDLNDDTDRWLTLRPGEYQLQRDMPTATFRSGLALKINGWASNGRDLLVAYKKPYSALSALDQDVEAISGLHATAHDILSIGAAIRLTVGSEIARNFLDQADTRRADEVPPQARAQQMRALAALRQDRISAEKARLYAKYPVVTR